MADINQINYQDPDYEDVPKSRKETVLSNDQKIQSICTIINKEFSAEIERKEKDIDLIDQRLLLAKKTLHRLRYAIVNSYYNSKQFHLNEEDVRKEVVNQKDPITRTKVHSMLKDDQKRIHPALKKILGSKPDVDLDELFKIRLPRKRQKVESQTSENMTIAVDNSIETLRSGMVCDIKSELVEDVDMEPVNVKVPRYIEPKNMEKNVLKIDAVIRNKQKEKFRIIIGNTSKYTPPHSEMDRSTHRWLLYIRGPRDNPDISHFVESVTVTLDSSYAPHNIIKLNSAPFHLSRRGWGEFDVGVQIHFKNEVLNKPVNLIHKLKLDRNYTGLQTLGGETVADIWLYCYGVLKPKNDLMEIENLPGHSKYSSYDSEVTNIKTEVEETSCYENVTSDSNCKNVVIKLEPKDNSYDEDPQSKALDISDNNNIEQNKVLDVRIGLPVASLKSLDKTDKLFTQKTKSLVKTHPNSLLKISNSDVSEESLFDQRFENGTSLEANIEAVLEDHCYVQGSHMYQSMGITYDLHTKKPFEMTGTLNKSVNVNFSSKLNIKNEDNAATVIINFLKDNIKQVDNIRSAVNIMLKNMPLIHNMAEFEHFLKVFPFAVQNEDIYFKLHNIKRRNLMWTRAKIIKNFLKSHWISYQNRETKMWTVKQILLYSQYHGFYPVDKSKTMCSKGNYNLNDANSIMPQEIKPFREFYNLIDINSLSELSKYSLETIDIKKEPLSEERENVESSVTEKFKYLCENVDSSEDEIDVIDTTDNTNKNLLRNEKQAKSLGTVLPFTNPEDRLICTFIEKICAKQGIELKNEDVGYGYTDCLVHKTILVAMKCLIEDVIRRSLAIKMAGIEDKNSEMEKIKIPTIWEISERGIPNEVLLKHVYEAICTKPELDLLTNFGLGTVHMDYSEKL